MDILPPQSLGTKMPRAPALLMFAFFLPIRCHAGLCHMAFRNKEVGEAQHIAQNIQVPYAAAENLRGRCMLL